MEGVQMSRTAWLAAALLASACQPDDPTKPPPPRFRLEGSLTQVIDLGYDEARVLFASDGTDVSLTFVRKRPADLSGFDAGAGQPQPTSEGEDVAFQVSYSLEGLEAYPLDTRVDLAEFPDGGMRQRGLTARNVYNDPRKRFPPLERGSLYMPGLLMADSVTVGDFRLTFVTGTEVASGRTVFGQFTARVAP
jgi:hypothetical protein